MGSDGANTVQWTIETLDTAFATYPLLPENSPALQVFAGLGLSAVGLDVVTDFAALVTGRDPLTGEQLSPRGRFYAWLAIGLPFVTAGALHAFADDAIEFAADLRPLRNVECSFDADTPVTTDEGPVAIRDIDVGDKVLAWDEALAAGGYYTVTAVWAHEDPVTVLLTVDGETIETTPEHPFLTADDTWVTAGELAAGDTLRSVDGDVGVVEEITFVVAPQVMYNMTVADAHTYVVGDGAWVVHNACRWLGNPNVISKDVLGEYLSSETKRYLRYLTPEEADYTTIAMTRFLHDGEWMEVVAVNGGAPRSAVDTLEIAVQTEGRVFMKATKLPSTPNNHAESYLYQAFKGEPGFSKIGVSNYTGPCPNSCSPWFRRIVNFLDVFWDDEFVPAGRR